MSGPSLLRDPKPVLPPTPPVTELTTSPWIPVVSPLPGFEDLSVDGTHVNTGHEVPQIFAEFER
jgi:hypothetical protein